MNRNHRRFTVLIILFMAGCGTIQSAQVQDQITGMIGLSKEHVLSCMGPPTSTATAGATEVWSYNTLGPITTSAVVTGNQSLMVGSESTSQEFCVVNLTMQGDRVVASNTRSRGKLLSPNLPCYAVLHACVPNPVPASAQADRTKEAVASCKELYQDPRLNPLRGIISLDVAPTLSMQSNQNYVTESQRAALDAYQPLHEECRNKLMVASPTLAKVMVKVQPEPYTNLRALYERNITIGEYNIRKQDEIDKMKAALVSPTT